MALGGFWLVPRALDGAHTADEVQRRQPSVGAGRVADVPTLAAAAPQDSRERFALDLERARREGFYFGAKLVRGAYMFLEREKAAKSGRPSPVWDGIQDTHANYDRHVGD